jgi:hypothetical protein
MIEQQVSETSVNFYHTTAATAQKTAIFEVLVLYTLQLMKQFTGRLLLQLPGSDLESLCCELCEYTLIEPITYHQAARNVVELNIAEED